MEVNRNLPARVDRERKWTAAELEVFADPKGEVLTCEVRRFVPHEVVAEEMCKVLIGRRVVPARNLAGEKTYGLGLMIIVVDKDGASNLAARLGGLRQDGMVLTVSRLPEGSEETPEARLPLDLEIDTQGEVARCEGPEDMPEAFREVACEQAAAQGFDVMTGAGGNAVPYVRHFDIVFELADEQAN